MKRAVNVFGRIICGKRMHIFFVLCATTAVALSAQTFSTVHSFDGTDGASPLWAALVQGTDGNLYGTTGGGGASGGGTVFKITLSGTLTTLYSFCSTAPCPDGESPYAGLVQAANGNFYGTANGGGANNSDSCISGNLIGCGTVFSITSGGTLTTLYSFCSQNGCADGAYPDAVLVQATDGNLYGTTYGGANDTCAFLGATTGCGTVFKIAPGGGLTTLYSFCFQSGCADGGNPVAGLVQATDGNFYGTTGYGGASDTCAFSGFTSGCGTIFKITQEGTLTTLHSFDSTDGSSPQGGLVQGTDENFYGTTSAGGTNNSCPSGCGTIFKITPAGALTTLHSFDGTDGAGPRAGLIQATDGNFYGTTAGGGANGQGTIFKITPGGTLTTLYSFCSQSGCMDGSGPEAALVQANGNFYGTTLFGGAFRGAACSSCGTVFSLSVGLGPSVPEVNAGGVLNSASYTTQGVASGSIVSIFGTNLAASTAAASTVPLPTALSDVTSVAFNGIPAGLYFVSQNQINAQLPFNVLPGQSSGAASIVITRSGGTSAPQSVTVVPASPGIFTTTANGLGQAFAYDNTTGALAAPVGAPIGPFTTAPISISSGDALIIACTGLGSVNPSIDNYVAASDGILRYTVLTPTVLIGGVPAQPIYSVLSPQFVSEYQIGVVPAPTTPTGDAVPVQIQIGGVTTSNQVTIAVAP